MQPHFDVVAVFVLERSHFSADPGTRFVNIYFIALIQELYSGGKTGKTRTDDGNFKFGGVGGGRAGFFREERAERDVFETDIVDVADVGFGGGLGGGDGGGSDCGQDVLYSLR